MEQEQTLEEIMMEVAHETSEHLEMYRAYCSEELEKGNDIPTFTEFRTIMNE
jgi:hypothetical protein